MMDKNILIYNNNKRNLRKIGDISFLMTFGNPLIICLPKSKFCCLKFKIFQAKMAKQERAINFLVFRYFIRSPFILYLILYLILFLYFSFPNMAKPSYYLNP